VPPLTSLSIVGGCALALGAFTIFVLQSGWRLRR